MAFAMNNVLGFLSLPGGTEWVVILLVALLLFGKRLPEVARSMGKSITEFKKGLSDAQRDIQASANSDGEPARPVSDATVSKQSTDNT